jgi:hypothetical protein
VPWFCASLCAAGRRARRIRPVRPSPRPLAGCRRARSSVDGDPFFSIHLPLRSTGFHRLRRYYEEIRLLHRHRLVVVASFQPTACGMPHRGPMQTSQGKDTEFTAAPVPNTAPTSVGFWASRSLARSPGRPGLLRASLAFGAAARLRLPPHMTSRPCSCLQLVVATNSLHRGLAPPFQGPCLAHQGRMKIGLKGRFSCAACAVETLDSALAVPRMHPSDQGRPMRPRRPHSDRRLPSLYPPLPT